MSPVIAIIAEDEAPQRMALRKMLQEVWPELVIAAECSDGLSALEAMQAHDPQVLFLDIRMPGLSGVAVAREVAGRAHIIFTTAYDEYAVAAFEEGAVDYLLKPIQRERLAKALDRLRKRLGEEPPAKLDSLLDRLVQRMRAGESYRLRWITAGAGDTVKLFPIEDVLFFQADEKYTRVATRSEDAIIRAPLKELLEGLDPEEFWQVHRSVIVRATAIEHAKRDELGKLRLQIRGRQETLPVSSAFQHRFKMM